MTPSARCGTNGGYHHHWRAGEPACRPCIDAHTKATRASAKARGPRRIPCSGGCGRVTASGRCRACAWQAKQDAEVAYTGGWVRDGLIMRPLVTGGAE